MDKIAFALYYFYFWDDEEVNVLEDVKVHWDRWLQLREALKVRPVDDEVRCQLERFEAIAGAINLL